MVQIGYDREILHMSDFRRTVSGFGRRKQTMTNSRHLPKTTYSQIKFSSYLICLNLYDPSFGVPRRAITPRPLQRGYEVTELACSLSLAGNITNATSSLILTYWNTPPKISPPTFDNLTINKTVLSIPIQIESELPTTSTVKVNGVLLDSFISKNFQVLIAGLLEGINQIEITVVDAAGNIAIPQILTINVDTKVPQVIAISPPKGKTFYTNTLPITIPVAVNFNEALVRGSVNGIAALLTGPTSISAQIEVAVAGATTIAIEVVDFAGNVSTITETITIAYSNTLPKIYLDESLFDLLTNETLINFFGTVDRVLASVTLNDIPINIGQDGISFSGIFQVPRDGRFEIKISVTDLFGNTSTISTFARIIQALPDVLKNFQPPTLIPKPPIGYIADYGPHLGRIGSPNCAAMNEIFSTVTEFSGNLRGITAIDPKPFLKKFPPNYRPKIPNMTTVKRFVGEIDEKLNSLKIAYLAICEGYNFILDPDCETGREVFRIIMRKYPEPMIIGAIPGLTVPLKNFLIKRFNICTGLDSSGLSCKDLVELLPGLAAYAAPAVGNLLSSPVAQLLLEEAACKNICEGALKDTPACATLPIPVIPEIKPDIIVSLTPDLPDLGGGSRFPDSDGGSDCDWWESCGSGDDDGGGSNNGGNASCNLIPGLWFCAPATDDRLPRSVPIDPIDCNAISNLSLLDIFSSSYNGGSTISFLTSIVSNCSKVPVDGFPKNRLPVITLSAPLDQQAVTDTVRVVGKVDDTSSVVKVNGVKVDVTLGNGSIDFDVVIPVPVNGVVQVEAQDSRGNLALPVVVNLANVQSGPVVRALTAGNQLTCGIIDNGRAMCWGSNFSGELGVGPIPSYSLFPMQVFGLESGVTSISASQNFACAVVNGAAKCWGDNFNGNLGNGTRISSNIPVQVTGLETGVTSISANGNYACAVVNGAAKCWGRGALGQLGNLSTGTSSVPEQVFGLTSGVTSISAGGAHACAMVNGIAKCWGYNPAGQLGNNSRATSYRPVDVVGLDAGITLLVAGGQHTCAINSVGTAKCWGGNFFGELGTGDYIDRLVPEPIPGLIGNVTSIRLGSSHTCAIDSGAAKCWGRNGTGELGDGTNNSSNVSVSVFGLSSNVTEIQTGSGFSCAVQNGVAKCWGQNGLGQLGNGGKQTFLPLDVVF